MNIPKRKLLGQDFLRIKGHDIQTEVREVDHNQLRFWPENPRIYSAVHVGEGNPSQEDIFNRLKTMEHVRQLVKDIRENEGLIDPIIVRGGSMEVLEGNSRLAAYRFLAKKDPLKWNRIRCKILPQDTQQSLIFTLLGQYHVRGKKDWAPYETAGFVYRCHEQQNMSIEDIASQLGMKKNEVSHLIKVYQFMLDHSESKIDRWSYYDEYLKSTIIRPVRKQFRHMDKFIVEEIQSGEIPRAVDIRDELKTICKHQKTLKKYLSKKITFDVAVEEAAYQGGSNSDLNRLKRFKNWISSKTPTDFAQYNRPIRQKIEFELKHIDQKVKSVRRAIDKKSSEID